MIKLLFVRNSFDFFVDLFIANFPFKHRVTLLDPKGDGLYFKQTYLNMMQKLNIDYNQGNFP